MNIVVKVILDNEDVLNIPTDGLSLTNIAGGVQLVTSKPLPLPLLAFEGVTLVPVLSKTPAALEAPTCHKGDEEK